MAVQQTPPPVSDAPVVQHPPRHLLFASRISDQQGRYTLSKSEIDEAIRQHGTNIAVMVDVGGRVRPSADAHDMLQYLKSKGVQHIGIYTEGRTGPTGKTYSPQELARRHDLATQYGMSDAQWMAGGWQKHFNDQVRHYSKEYGARFFEADNIPQGQTIDFMRQFQAQKDRGNLPAHAQMLLKNPNAAEIAQLGSALNDRSVRRTSVADFAISEEDDHAQWSSLRAGLSAYGVQLATSDDTNRYAAKQSYDQRLMGAYNRYAEQHSDARDQGWRVNTPTAQVSHEPPRASQSGNAPSFRMHPV